MPRPIERRQSGFTLIEAVVAMGIIVVVMGASLTANRVVQQNILSSQNRSQMEHIASETIALVEQSVRNNTTGTYVGSYLGIVPGGTEGEGNPAEGVFYDISQRYSTAQLGLTCAESPCRSIAQNGVTVPVLYRTARRPPGPLISYVDTVLNLGEGENPGYTIGSVVWPPECTGSTCSLDTVFETHGYHGDIVAVPTHESVNRGLSVDNAHPNGFSSANPLKMATITAANRSKWNFYIRSFSIQTFDGNCGFYGSSLNASAAQVAELCNATLSVTVKVTNLYNRQEIVQKSAIIMDNHP